MEQLDKSLEETVLKAVYDSLVDTKWPHGWINRNDSQGIFSARVFVDLVYDQLFTKNTRWINLRASIFISKNNVVIELKAVQCFYERYDVPLASPNYLKEVKDILLGSFKSCIEFQKEEKEKSRTKLDKRISDLKQLLEKTNDNPNTNID